MAQIIQRLHIPNKSSYVRPGKGVKEMDASGRKYYHIYQCKKGNQNRTPGKTSEYNWPHRMTGVKIHHLTEN